MGFPIGYNCTDVLFPKFFIQTLSILGFINSTIFTLFKFLGLSHFLEPEPQFHENQIHTPIEPPLSAVLIQELLPVIKFSDLKVSWVDSSEEQPPEGCAVCLDEFEDDEEIRSLLNCKHIFHKRCVDHWMDHDRQTCPLCREHLVPLNLQEQFNKRLWADSYVDSQFYSEDNFIPAF